MAQLFRVLADNSVDVNKIVSETSETGTLEISFTVSKVSQPAFMGAYSEFHDEMLDGGTLPLDLLEARTDKWIAQQKAK